METPSETFLEIAAVIAPGNSNPKSSRRTSQSGSCETRLAESVRLMQDRGVLGGIIRSRSVSTVAFHTLVSRIFCLGVAAPFE